MAFYNVVFAVDVDCRSEELSDPRDVYRVFLKRWILKVLLSLGSKYGFEKVRWGYRFFHSRTVKSASLKTRGADFRELQEKAFSDFEDDFLKFSANYRTSEQHRLQSSPASCMHSTLKEIILDFQWDRPDITSPTKLTLRPRRSVRNTKNISLADDELCLGKNVLFVVSTCPHSKRELDEFLCSSDTESQKDLFERVLPKRLIDLLIQRKVDLHWADCNLYKGTAGSDDYMGLNTIMEVLQLVAGKVVPVASPWLALNHEHHNVGIMDYAFPTGAVVDYILSSEKINQRCFPAQVGTLCWGTDENKQICGVSFEPVSCRQRLLCAPVEVRLRTVLQGLGTSSICQSASESWVLSSPGKPEQHQLAFQCLLKELSVHTSHMLAEVNEGILIRSAVLSVLSPYSALLTVLQPLATQCEEVLNKSHVSSETADNSTDLPDVVSSVLNMMWDIMEVEDNSEEINPHQIPDWAHQELQQGTNLPTDLVEGYFCLSDQSGISCDLMELMRLLHAAPEENEQTEEHCQLELTHNLAELYQSSSAGSSTGPKGKKKGTQRTPVRQKMKTMSRSLQMLNVARFNIKEQKSQTETEHFSSTRGAEKHGKRHSGERTKTGPLYFKSEEELFSHLKMKYQQAVEDRSLHLFGQVQYILTVMKTFIKSNTDIEASLLDLIKKTLLKSTQSVRQLYGNATSTEDKVRDCQLQVVIRLEMCRQPSLDQHPDDVEQMVEEVAGMLRIISLTNDPVYLSKFMQEEILPLYIKDIPKILADIYHSLGTQLPEILVSALPSDFFSDDSIAKDVSVSPSPLSATQSIVSSVGNPLEELRKRSAKKRRTSMLSRHKSMTEVSQTRRQIEMPRKSTRQTKTKECASLEKKNAGSLPSQKQAVQEVTKVRRNLFNQEMVSPSKKVKMPRSQSVSALEGIKKRKRSQMDDGRQPLLTKKVSETPLHKQVSNRLLQRQKNGRRSGDNDMVIIEESPVKPAMDLRRSPRIKSLARRHSSVFYSSSQPRSRNLERALSSSQLLMSEGKGGVNIGAIKSPVRLLFGAALSPVHPSTSSWGTRACGKARLESTDSVFENPNKTPRKSPYKSPYKSGSAVGSRTPRTPTTSSNPQGSPFPKSPGHAVGENGMILRGSPFRSSAAKNLLLETPKKSPLKGILRTPVKSLMEHSTFSDSCLRSPNTRTPKKTVTWSPNPRECLSEKPFKVPESPQYSKRYSPKLITPSKSFRCNDFKTPDKLTLRKSRLFPETHNVSEIADRSEEIGRTSNLPGKAHSQNHDTLSIENLSPPTPETTTQEKSPEPTYRISTRSGSTSNISVSTVPHDQSESLLSNSRTTHKVISLPIKEKTSNPFLRSHSTGYASSASTSNLRSTPDHTGVKHTPNGEHGTTKTVDGQNQESTKGKLEEGSSSDSQQFDSSQCSAATTTEDSIDIAEASVVKTELTGGIKMNISFSRKSSKSSGVFEFTGTPPFPAEATQGRSYGFRQTPDRQQRKAAARLGYSPGLPKFSTPRVSRTPAHGRKPVEHNPRTYQVELEMQASGLPKLKFKRTDSFNSGETTDYTAIGRSPHVKNVRVSRVDSPIMHCSKHREPGCISPSLCTHGTPGKGGVQTFICQSITPTRLPNNSPSPLGAGESMPWTPSPQSRGWSTPENLNSWPRKKRARTGMLGTKDNAVKGEAEILEDPELDGVFRLQGTEEPKESRTPVSKYKLVATPPSSKVKTPVSVSGILALTQSPLLYKGAKATVSKETTQSDGSNGNSEQYSNKGVFTADVSPFSQLQRHQGCGRTYRRKRLLES